MPLGENVGAAYVRIYADGSGVPGDIRDSMEDADPYVRAAGRRHGAAYEKAWEERMKNGEIAKNLRTSLGEGIADGMHVDEFFGSSQWKQVRKKITSEWGDVGTEAADALAKEFINKGSLEGIEKATRDMNQRVAKIMKDNEDALHKEALARNKAFDAEMLRNHAEALRMNAEMDKAAARLKAELDKKRIDDEKAWRAEFDKTNRAISDSLKRSQKDLTSYNASILRARDLQHSYLVDRLKAFDLLRERNKQAYEDAQRTGSQFETLARHMDRIGDSVGRAFGKGSRNNFLNAFGRFVAIGPSVISGLLRVGGALSKVGDLFFKVGEDGTRTFSLLSGVGSLLGAAAVGFGALVAAAAAFIFIAGPLAALISGIAAALVALVSTVAFAAVGLGAVLAVGLLPLVAGLGVTVGAILAMSDAQKKVMKNAIKPFTEGLKHLGSVAANTLTPKLKQAAETIEPLFKGLAPVTRRIASAIGDVANSFAKAVVSDGFVKFRDAMEKFLPRAVRRLGEITKNTLGGFGGILRGAIPITKQFLRYLDRTTERFSDWANSAKGQKAIKNFFADAADSAKDLWHFLDKVWELTTDLLASGKDTGDDLFSKMGDSIQEFGDYLKANPDLLDKWFANGKDVAVAMGDLAVNLGKVFDELDDDQNRESLQGFLDFMNGAASIGGKVATGLGYVADAFGAIKYVVSGKWVQDAYDAFDKLFKKFSGSNFINSIRGWFTGGGGGKGVNVANIINVSDISKKIRGALPSGGQILKWMGGVNVHKIFSGLEGIGGWVAGHFAGLGMQILNRIGRVPLLQNFVNPVQQVLGWFAGMAGKVLSRIGDVKLIDAFNNPVETIVGWFQGLAGRISSALGSISFSINWPSPPSWLGKLGGAITGPLTASGGVFSGAQHRIIGEAGPEAVVPLNRALSQVDPSVRALSAIAQGRGMTYTGGSSGKTIDVGGIIVQSNAKDPEAVATEVINRLVAAAF